MPRFRFLGFAFKMYLINLFASVKINLAAVDKERKFLFVKYKEEWTRVVVNIRGKQTRQGALFQSISHTRHRLTGIFLTPPSFSIAAWLSCSSWFYVKLLYLRALIYYLQLVLLLLSGLALTRHIHLFLVFLSSTHSLSLFFCFLVCYILMQTHISCFINSSAAIKYATHSRNMWELKGKRLSGSTVRYPGKYSVHF